MEQMTIEKLQEELTRKESLIKELTAQNEHLYHQYNHLIVRNNKFLQRINDMQIVISELHQHIQDLQTANYKLLQGKSHLSQASANGASTLKSDDQENSPAFTALFERWKNFPGQQAHNAPNIRKQVLLLTHLNQYGALKASELFLKTGINGVTGARYVSTLKKFNLIEYKGARKKGHYHITEQGRRLVNGSLTDFPVSEPIHQNIEPIDNDPELQALHTDRVTEFKSVEPTAAKPKTLSNFDHIDL
jgi:uncharacterized protein YoxC/predicted transcriptional regulator